ncbi:MAG: hypothetical protein ACRDCG_01775 [Mycoplasmoidaceae bacterium]
MKQRSKPWKILLGLKIVLSLIIITVLSLMVYDQLAIDFGTKLHIKGVGILKAFKVEEFFNKYKASDKFRLIGYYMAFYGSVALFIFIIFSMFLGLIPVFGKLILMIFSILPAVSIIVIIIGALIISGTIPNPGLSAVH